MSNYPLLPSHIILSALAGDKYSISYILSHYQYYINSFCITHVKSKNHPIRVELNEEKKKQLEAKLSDAILKFKVR